ncbi:MAG: DUF3106 domain-containing protein [Rhodoferax sp.]|nr:DUF3106 domain-containing protein [Rhodoferax sp.]
MQQAPVRKLNPLATGAAVLAAAFLLLFGLLRFVPGDREHVTPAAPAAAPTLASATAPTAAASLAAAPAKPPVRVSKTAGKNAPRNAPRSAWNELTAAQQEALQPLAANWATMSPGQRRKWLAISKNFPSMPIEEQATLYSRMTEWVSLSAQQRTQARLNFAETKQLSAEEKRAKWQAYQALSPEEKQKLEAKAPPRIKGAATSVRPAPSQKMATIRTARPNPSPGPENPSKTAPAQRQVDRNTLLPHAPEALLPEPAPAPAAPPNQ